MKIQEICFILFIFYISGISALLGLSFHKWGYINVVINRFKRIFRILHWLPRTVEWESSQILYLIFGISRNFVRVLFWGPSQLGGHLSVTGMASLSCSVGGEQLPSYSYACDKKLWLSWDWWLVTGLLNSEFLWFKSCCIPNRTLKLFLTPSLGIVLSGREKFED